MGTDEESGKEGDDATVAVVSLPVNEDVEDVRSQLRSLFAQSLLKDLLDCDDAIIVDVLVGWGISIPTKHCCDWLTLGAAPSKCSMPGGAARRFNI
ncbi:unnamed protein product [Anisakis simplex]|uniref:Uncharacterized protein n=1 Tax=Anisakis simplex TaxID=6269 RepID=A0A0M3JIU9_ANISI|nr:unnamed protein product [Anisakis simplex]